MLTRPLDLAAKLRPPPRSYDGLFFVNAGLIALFFVLFGSRYVLSPGLGVEFELPQMPGAGANMRLATHVITVRNAGQVFVDDGARSIEELSDWLKAQSKRSDHPILLIRASAGVPTEILMRIVGIATVTGYSPVVAAEEPAPADSDKRP